MPKYLIPKTSGVTKKYIFGETEIYLGTWSFELVMELIEESENYYIVRHLGYDQILCWPKEELEEFLQ